MSKKKYQELAEKFLPAIREICQFHHVPFQVCFAQLVQESGGKSELAKVHNYFGLKYRKALRAKLDAQRIIYGKYIKLTRERITLRDKAHYENLTKRSAAFQSEVVIDPEAFFGERITIRLPLPFFSFGSMEDGIAGYCLFVKRSRYKDAHLLHLRPVRWIGYIWGRGYATGDHYPEAVVKRMRSCYEHLNDSSFYVSINKDLAELLEELRKLDGPDRWDLAQNALDYNGFTELPSEEVVFSEVEAVL